MNTLNLFDTTICAIATGVGGAISTIRVSGAEAIPIVAKSFQPKATNINILNAKGYSLHYGSIVDSTNEIIDDVIIGIFRAPHSYTGEDSVEISCHASKYIRQKIMEILVCNGATVARAGEFTQRAFLNGKMDLSQAEAVADIIASESRLSHRIAMNQMRGFFSDEIATLRQQLLHFASMIELELDFGEEDVEFADRTELIKLVSDILEKSHRLTASFAIGNVIKNGIPVAIVGNPNTGKSTLLNRLLKEERAIVSDIAGTTRDAIEDTIIIDDIEFRFIDTAGLRNTTDIIENLGIGKTKEKIAKSTIIIVVTDINEDFSTTQQLLDNISSCNKDKQIIVLANKCDIASEQRCNDYRTQIKLIPNAQLIFTSAHNGDNIHLIEQTLSKIAATIVSGNENIIISNVRHYEALNKVIESLERAREGLQNNLPEDLVAIDIRQAIHYLGTIIGTITENELLGFIFSHFCIGK